MTVYVRDLADAGDAASAGGKGARLGELIRAGFPVPPGYVVTAEAFTADGVPAPDGLAAQIAAAYAALGADVPVAVRSSATMEDGTQASFAGLQDTYLDVCGADAVLDAVRSVWASLYNEEAVAYRRRLAIPEDGMAMAVVVQRMVHPRSAGVMFTRSPVTGDRSVVAIEGTWGLGSALVAGEVTPDSFTVSKVTGEITGRPDGSCLTKEEIRALADLAGRVEEHYGCAQDIEWAILGAVPADVGPAAERVVLLQSRPETVWAVRARVPVATPKARACDHVLATFGPVPGSTGRS
jgi:pyruvate, water dikinase